MSATSASFFFFSSAAALPFSSSGGGGGIFAHAAVENAKRILALGMPFADWLESHHPLTKEEWVRLFKKTFVFTGGEITGSFLLSIGYLPGAHDERCPAYKRIAQLRPAWMR